MANRFWVGGTGTWDSTDTTHWSTLSGGGGGASAPGSADTAIFDASSGGGTVTPSGNFTIGVLNMSAAAAMTLAGTTSQLTINGSVTLGTNVTYSASFTMILTGVCSFTSNGKSIGNFIQVGVASGSSGTVTLADALTTTGDLTISNGTFDANNVAFSVGNIVVVSGGDTRTLTLGSATHTVLDDITVGAGAATPTINGGTGKIILSKTTHIIAGNNQPEHVFNNIDVPNLSSDFAQIGFTCRNLDFTGCTGGSWDGVAFITGNLTLSASIARSDGSTTNLVGSSGTQVITTNGVTVDGPITINAAGATVQLAGALTLGATRTLTLTAGTLNANNQTISTGLFSSNNSTTRTITMGSGLWTLTGTGTVWNLSTTTNLTFNKETANIKITDTSSSSVTFAGGGLTYNNVWFSRGSSTGTNIVTGADSIATLQDDGTGAHQITLPASTTITVTTFSVSGNPGALISIRSSSAGVQSTLSQASGTVNSDYLDIKDSNAIGGAVWNPGTHSVNSGNNTGWLFPSIEGSNPFLGFSTTVIAINGSMVGY